MAIKNWHVGKLVLLWGWGLTICVVLIRIVTDRSLIANAGPGFILLALVVAIPLLLSAVTWTWLSGKEESHSGHARKA